MKMSFRFGAGGRTKKNEGKGAHTTLDSARHAASNPSPLQQYLAALRRDRGPRP